MGPEYLQYVENYVYRVVPFPSLEEAQQVLHRSSC